LLSVSLWLSCYYVVNVLELWDAVVMVCFCFVLDALIIPLKCQMQNSVMPLFLMSLIQFFWNYLPLWPSFDIKQKFQLKSHDYNKSAVTHTIFNTLPRANSTNNLLGSTELKYLYNSIIYHSIIYFSYHISVDYCLMKLIMFLI